MHPDFTPNALIAPSEVRACESCGATLIRHANEAKGRFAGRRFCNHLCRTRAMPPPRNPKYDTSERTCPVCGQAFRPYEGETPSTYQRRQTCSPECGRILGDSKRTKRVDDHYCASCGTLLVERPDEKGHPARFARRRFCDPQCAASERKVQRCAKTCSACGIQFESSGNEKAYLWTRRRTCSPECRAKLAGKAIAQTMSGATRRKCLYPAGFNDALKDAIRTRDGNACRLCGATEGRTALPVHHIDYEKQNIRRDNLITLCSPCHGKTNRGVRAEWIALFRGMLLEENQT